MEKKNDPVNHPSHYRKGKIEVIDFIEDQNFDYQIGNAVKYLCRYKHKGNPIEDLEKAIWYIKRKIDFLIKNQVLPKEELDLKVVEVPSELIEKPSNPIYGTTSELKQGDLVFMTTMKKQEVTKEELENTIKYANTDEFKNHTTETCKWGGCYKCDPENHKGGI